MHLPWTVIVEADGGDVSAHPVLSERSVAGAIRTLQARMPHVRVLGALKGSHTGAFYGIQVVERSEDPDQLKIPFPRGPQ